MIKNDLIALLETIAIYNDAQFAEMYFARWEADLPFHQLNAFSRRLGTIGTILDAGCGPGHHSAYLHKLGHHVIGIDLAEASLQLARAHFHGPVFEQMDMLRTSFPDSLFTGIWACASVMHLPRNLLESQLVEFYRLLGARGILALTMTLDGPAHKDSFGRFFEAYTSVDLIAALTASGFDIVDRETRVREKNTEQNGEKAHWITITSVKAR
jgi:SAM-dependent methyltransferase